MTTRKIIFHMTLTFLSIPIIGYFTGTGAGLYSEVLDPTQALITYAIGFGTASMLFFLMNYLYYRNSKTTTFLKDYKKTWKTSGGIGLIMAFTVFFGVITFFTAGLIRFANLHLEERPIQSYTAYIGSMIGYTNIPNPNRPLEIIYSYDISIGYVDENEIIQTAQVQDAINSSIENGFYNDFIPPQIGDPVTYNIHIGTLGIKWHEVK